MSGNRIRNIAKNEYVNQQQSDQSVAHPFGNELFFCLF